MYKCYECNKDFVAEGKTVPVYVIEKKEFKYTYEDGIHDSYNIISPFPTTRKIFCQKCWPLVAPSEYLELNSKRDPFV